MTQAQHELETWLLLDQTPSMAFGTVVAEKADLATTVAAVVGLLTDGPGNRLGVGVLRTDGVAWSSPLAGRIAAHRVLRTAPGRPGRDRVPDLGRGVVGAGRPAPPAGAAGDRLRPHRPRGSGRAPFDWEAPLRRLGARHDVVVVEVVDPRELELPAVGQLVLVDPESGRQREVNSGDRRLRTAYASAAAVHRSATADAVRAARAGHVLLRTDNDWVAELARFVRARRRLPVRRTREENAMTFLTPIWLLLLLPVAALAAAYVVVLRRRQRYAVRFASLPMLERVVPRRPGWRRHVPATLVLLALTCLGLAAARPEMTLRLPYDRATVMVAIDTSGSMAATDVPPNRLEAAKAAAVAFVDDLPDTVNVGVVSFAGSSVVVSAPTTDHAQVLEQIGALDLGGGGTAIGEAVFSSLGQVGRMTEQADAEPVPTRVVLLSDGENTAGRSPEVAAAAAAEAALPVSTIAYGTPNGTIQGPQGSSRVPVDEAALRELAEATGGTAYTAQSGEELRSVYDDIGSSIGWRTQQQEVTPYLAALGLLVAVGAGALSLRWFSRLI